MQTVLVYLAVTTDSVSVEVPVHFIRLSTWRPGGKLTRKLLFLSIDDLREAAASCLNLVCFAFWSFAN